MYYPYNLIVVEPKINKWKIFIVVLIVLVIILLSIYGGIKYAKYIENKKFEQQLQKEQEQKEEQKKIEEEKEAKRLKNSKPLTQEQMGAIENIYTSEEKRVFLTFDDGPTTSVTPFILDLLKEENIKATFFVLGNRAKSNPDLIKREFEEGHYIANHGYTHKYSSIYTNSQTVLDEYNYTEGCIQDALQNPDYHSRVFRFPGGSVGGYYKNIKMEAKGYLRQNGIVSLDWNSLSKDAEGAKTKEMLLQNVIDTVGNKQSVVILMHDAADKILTYETLPSVIQYLRENGYSFKNLYDILGDG
ncbi:MAG: polysaccharide deacetylase [Clostridia bacterium]|nr:polysaccharide deacetylase [Clostridia bacterium]